MFDKLLTGWRAMFGPSVPRPPVVPRTVPGPAGRSIRAQVPYEAGVSPAARRGAGWTATDQGPIAATLTNASTIRARARHAWRNDPLARQIAEAWVSECVGWGPAPRSLARDALIRDMLMRWWSEWNENVTSSGDDFATVVSAAVRGVVVDGEIFIRLRSRRPSDGLVVPLQLEVIDPARVPVEMTQSMPNGGRVVGGVEFDALGRRVAYHVNDSAPGDPVLNTSSATPRRVPAAEMLHVFDAAVPGQVRGISMLSTSLVKLRQIDILGDATLMRVQIANLFAGFLKRPAGLGSSTLNPITGAEEDTDSLGRQLVGLEPGIMQELAPGEDLELSDPPDPPSTDVFMVEQMRLAAMAAGVPLEVLTGDWRGANDRVARVVLHGWRRRVEQFRWSVLTPRLLRPLWRAFVDASGVTPQPGADDEGWKRATWRHHSWPYIHPVQDVRSTIDAVRAGLTSLTAAVAEASGEDAEAVLKQIAEDNRRADALGLKLDSDPRGGGAK